jgi:gliding motility-associated-like protein
LTFIPNSFSPNSNGRNDTWKPSVFEFGSYELKVFNRWGEVVFTSYDPEIGWNGQKHNDGPPCPVGVYTYDLLITDKLGEPYNYQGRLNLIH